MASGLTDRVAKPPRQTLKDARFQQRLCKILGLKRAASVDRILAELATLVAKDKGARAARAAAGGAHEAADHAEDQHTAALRQVAALLSTAAGAAMLGARRQIALPERLEALRRETAGTITEAARSSRASTTGE